MQALAWTGYDYEEKTIVDIGSGNLVREGYIIDLYQQKTDDFIQVKVLNIADLGNSTEISIYDLNSHKKRILIMKN
jgi:predicted RNA-binding protein with RPS1 domain